MQRSPHTSSVPATAAEMMPLVYSALQRLAARKLVRERPGQALEPTALVHEVYMRLVRPDPYQRWDNRGHFFAAAMTVMDRILVERARRNLSQKHGGHLKRVDADLAETSSPTEMPEVAALSEALRTLEQKAARPARIVHLRYYGGLTIEQAARVVGVSIATVKKDWAYARSWLRQQLEIQGFRSHS
ncbi:MAG: ECF-type sigma factor [Gemmataceae bacterium]